MAYPDGVMLFLATTATTTADRLRQIPTDFWLRLGLAIVVLVVAIVVLRKVAKVNKVILTIGVGLVLSIVGFNWIYERNEPTWATPTVRWLAGFFPSKGTADKHRM